jgi:tetratricopeptide (TPR) repeat protein
MAVWQQAVRVSPGVPDAWNGMGATHSAAGRSDAAIAAFRRAIAVGPQYADAYYNLGRELLLRGKVQEATPYLEFAMTHEPGSAAIAIQLGTAYERSGRAAGAEALYRRALERRPEFVPALIRLAIVEAAQGRREAGLAHARQALALAPSDAFANLTLATLLSERSGASPEVVASLERAIAARPGWVDPVNQLAWLLATDPDPAQRAPAHALALADSALALTPDANVSDTRAAALGALGRFDEAVAAAERARTLALAAHDTTLARDIAARLEGYHRGRPFVQKPVAGH